MNMYRLYKGFNKIDKYKTVFEAKQNVPKDDGAYNLIGDGWYHDSWIILNGVTYNQTEY